jgi:Protein of unknown function (DUF1592)/Protein of unknown function (DUF1588)/Protein of unknown function (DUF1585)/Protein of unknown function (DUF1595)
MARQLAKPAWLVGAVFSAGLAACSGSITDPSGGGVSEKGGATGTNPNGGTSGSTGSVGEDPNTWLKEGDPAAASDMPLRLMTRQEYDNTIALIFTDEYGVVPAGLAPGKVLPGETVDLSGFLSVGEVSEVHVLRQGEAAAAVTNALRPNLNKLVGCDLTKVADDAGCIRAFLPAFGELLYRRPLTSDEITQHLAFYDEERKLLGQLAPAAALALIETMLQSPHFQYRWEQGWQVPERKGNVVRLNSYQVASRLAFFLWGSGPDRALLNLAKTGKLSTPAEIFQQATAMLASPRAVNTSNSFHSQWLGLAKLDTMTKDKNRFPKWDAAMGVALRREIEVFAQKTLLEGDGNLVSLLTAPSTYINQSIASIYGINGITGAEFRKTDLNPAQRAGLLTMPGLMAASADASVANPFRRGKLVLDKILCQSLEPPAVIPEPPAFDPADPRSEREVLQDLTSAPACRGCHQHINPYGFGLGNFDAIGQFQTKDEVGKPVDASGTMPDTDFNFAGPVELAKLLSQSDEVRACLTRQWFRFALSRHEDGSDSFSMGTAYKTFADKKYNLRELLMAIVTTRSFLYRTLEATETVEVKP